MSETETQTETQTEAQPAVEQDQADSGPGGPPVPPPAPPMQGTPAAPGAPVNALGQTGRIESYRAPNQAMIRGALPDVVATLRLYHSELVGAGFSEALADALVLQLQQASWESLLGGASGRPGGRGGPRAQGFR